MKILRGKIKAGIASYEKELEINFFLFSLGPSAQELYQIRQDELGNVALHVGKQTKI